MSIQHNSGVNKNLRITYNQNTEDVNNMTYLGLHLKLQLPYHHIIFSRFFFLTGCGLCFQLTIFLSHDKSTNNINELHFIQSSDKLVFRALETSTDILRNFGRR